MTLKGLPSDVPGPVGLLGARELCSRILDLDEGVAALDLAIEEGPLRVRPGESTVDPRWYPCIAIGSARFKADVQCQFICSIGVGCYARRLGCLGPVHGCLWEILCPLFRSPLAQLSSNGIYDYIIKLPFEDGNLLNVWPLNSKIYQVITVATPASFNIQVSRLIP